jgi:hypothetical protein
LIRGEEPSATRKQKNMGAFSMRTAWAVGASLVASVAVQPAIASNLPFNNTAETTLSEDIVSADESKIYTHGPKFLTAPGAITAVWANTGEDKVTQEELRTRKGNRVILNRAWDGKAVHLFGARNEVVAFNLVLEAAGSRAGQVSVEFNRLTAPNGFVINSAPLENSAGIFDWTRRDIELFYVRYLRIRGLSALSYGTYDERHIPSRFRRPRGADDSFTGGWADRPDHDKHYPDIAVPMELVPTFSIAAGQNQSIWADIYIPKNAPAGMFKGEVIIRVAGVVTYRVPVRLDVLNFSLPDVPSSKTMVATSYHDVAQRYTGVPYPDRNSPQDKLTKLVMDRQMLLAHRHKISLIDDNSGAGLWNRNQPRPEWEPRLSGELFTPANGYRGPGTGVGNNVFSIATYGQWQDWWGTPSPEVMWKGTDAWESWFAANYPSTDRFLYLIDESEDYAQTETWAGWMKSNPGVGSKLKSFATADLLKVRESIPSLSISASWISVAKKLPWETAVTGARTSGKEVYLYNGQRPASGSFAIEDDGVALRELAWGQYKKNINRWFFWEATYYDDYQGGRGQTNVFKNAQTFGGKPKFDSVLGMSGWNSSNGDGVLFYPGIDKAFPSESYELPGPIASLRLKYWRRGIQDVDYITMAAQVNPQAVAALVQNMVPKALWENGVTDPADPTWVFAPISWSIDPDDWESARRKLARIIEGD